MYVWLNMEIFKCLVSSKTNESIFHPLEAVGRVSETQLQVGEKLNKMVSHKRESNAADTRIGKAGPFPDHHG